jgi:menaquinone-dependent protoporphyrinogen IX oxidase
MRTLIIYTSITGSTKQYALWLNEDIKDSDICVMEDCDEEKLKGYDRVVIGSYIRAGKIKAIEFLKDNWEVLKSKRPVIFIVGLLDPNMNESKKAYELIPEHIRDVIKYVKLPGRFDKNKMNIFEKLMVKLIKFDAFGEFKRENIKEVIEMI